MQSATTGLSFPTRSFPVETSFDIEQLTSDGGLLWLAEADDEVGLSASFADQLVDWRRGPVRHQLPTLVRQRILQIAAGYPDQNDATTLRHDPALKLSCDRRPTTGQPLASQPTLSRLDNAVDAATCQRLADALLRHYLEQRAARGMPAQILLDIDSTDDPTHGNQEGTRYHGYYRQHMYHPLLIFDGETNQLISARLRPGNAHASWELLPELERIVAAIRARWPQLPIAVRADAGSAIPEVYEWCEAAKINYTIGLISNARLKRLAVPLLARAQAAYDRSGTKVRLVDEINYQSGSWDQPRRVIVKAEVMEQGTNTRFVVTNRSDPPQALYDHYVQRGETENWIKDFKCACQADRLSCSRFWANQFRLLLHAAAYWLLDTLRCWLTRRGVKRMQLDTLRLQVVKIGGWMHELTQQVRLHLASSYPGQPLWLLLADRSDRS